MVLYTNPETVLFLSIGESMNKQWFKLDTAGLIFPATRRKNWINVFRISATLIEPIDPIILQQAVDQLKKRFPSFYVALKPGFFWNYLQSINQPLLVRQDYASPLIHMSKKELRRCCMRIYYHQNRIAVEFFHSITDGTGGSVFVRSLVGHYLKLKYHLAIPYDQTTLDPEQPVQPAELEDSFLKYSNDYANSRKERTAYHLHGTPQYHENFLTLVTGVVKTDQLKALAQQYHCTITALLTAVMIQSIIPMQEKEVVRGHQKPVCVSIAANLRKIFPSKTLRNFVLSENIGIDPLQGDYTLHQLCKVISNQMALKFTEQNMASEIASNVIPQKNPIIRLVPLPLKHVVMDLVYSFVGERTHCTNISNLGLLTLPEPVSAYVERMEFIIGVQRSYPNNTSVVSIGNTTCINMVRSIKESELERRFFTSLVQLGLEVTIESNKR